jgi:predicted P-loop ATPase
MMIDGLKGFGPTLDDAAVDRLWLTMDRQLKFRPGYDLMFRVIKDAARVNEFHPVIDYLDGLKWDGVERIDKWLTTYAGAEESEYTKAVGELVLIAAVRRIKHPGCKFDELVVLEASQGTDRSTAVATLAVNPDWFSDDLPLNASSSQKVIEQLQGKWIIEAAELSGMRKADVEHLKAFLSRQYDRSRMAYGRLVKEAPRQCVIIGTTNASRYLKDTTGNRRYWPVAVKRFDTTALKRDRDQLWAEAVVRERLGEPIRLKSALWGAAAKAQADRLIDDPFFDTLEDRLDQYEIGKISNDSVWAILDVRGRRSQDDNLRMIDAMRRLGWRRPESSVWIGGKKRRGFIKGEEPHPVIEANRDERGRLNIGLIEEVRSEEAQGDLGLDHPNHPSRWDYRDEG